VFCTLGQTNATESIKKSHWERIGFMYSMEKNAGSSQECVIDLESLSVFQRRIACVNELDY